MELNRLQGCVKQCIPKIKIHNVNSVAGWNEYVSHYYSMSRIDFKWWVSHNRPRHGLIYHAMRLSHAQFKYMHLDNADLKNLQLTVLN